jgi:O-antigen/teichoic acid export membrane protein
MLAPSAIMRILFGSGFIPGARALWLMAPTLIAAAISIPMTSLLTGSAKSRFVTYLLGGTLVPRTILLWALTRGWGLSGAAVATLISEFIMAALCVFAVRKAAIGFGRFQWYPSVVAGAVAYFVGYLGFRFTANEIIAAALGFLVFCIFSWKTMARLFHRAGDIAPKPRPAGILDA